MATFKITKKTTVGDLKQQFRDQVGATLRIFNGGKKAEDDEKLVDLGAKVGELECRTSRTVGKFVEAMKDELNVKLKVRTADDWVTVIDGLTLATVKDLPKQTTKTVMEDYLSYQRKDAEKSSDDVHEDNDEEIEEIEVDGNCFTKQTYRCATSDTKFLEATKEKMLALPKVSLFWLADDYSVNYVRWSDALMLFLDTKDYDEEDFESLKRELEGLYIEIDTIAINDGVLSFVVVGPDDNWVGRTDPMGDFDYGPCPKDFTYGYLSCYIGNKYMEVRTEKYTFKNKELIPERYVFSADGAVEFAKTEQEVVDAFKMWFDDDEEIKKAESIEDIEGCSDACFVAYNNKEPFIEEIYED